MTQPLPTETLPGLRRKERDYRRPLIGDVWLTCRRDGCNKSILIRKTQIGKDRTLTIHPQHAYQEPCSRILNFQQLQSHCLPSEFRELIRGQRPDLRSRRASASTLIRRFLGIPPFTRPNSTTCALGKNRDSEIAVRTLFPVVPDPPPELFATCDTVVVEAGASLAPFFLMHKLAFNPKGASICPLCSSKGPDTFPHFAVLHCSRAFGIHSSLLEIEEMWLRSMRGLRLDDIHQRVHEELMTFLNSRGIRMRNNQFTVRQACSCSSIVPKKCNRSEL